MCVSVCFANQAGPAQQQNTAFRHWLAHTIQYAAAKTHIHTHTACNWRAVFPFTLVQQQQTHMDMATHANCALEWDALHAKQADIELERRQDERVCENVRCFSHCKLQSESQWTICMANTVV